MVAATAVSVLLGVSASATTPPSSTVPPTVEAPPVTEPPAPTSTAPTLDSTAVRNAKVGWARFVADNFATPTSVPDPCPLLAAEAATGGVAALGLTPTDLPFGVAIYNDTVGAGITGIRCGVDFNKTPTPSGATSYAVEVTVLDGQATFPQYVTRVAGNNTPITQAPELGGEVIGRCRNEPAVCVASWHSRGLVVTVRLDGPRTDQSEAQARQMLAALVPPVVANVAAVPAP